MNCSRSRLYTNKQVTSLMTCHKSYTPSNTPLAPTPTASLPWEFREEENKTTPCSGGNLPESIAAIGGNCDDDDDDGEIGGARLSLHRVACW